MCVCSASKAEVRKSYILFAIFFLNEKWTNIALELCVQIHMETIKHRWKSMEDWP